jgi:hypothetical protein
MFNTIGLWDVPVRTGTTGLEELIVANLTIPQFLIKTSVSFAAVLRRS